MASLTVRVLHSKLDVLLRDLLERAQLRHGCENSLPGDGEVVLYEAGFCALAGLLGCGRFGAVDGQLAGPAEFLVLVGVPRGNYRGAGNKDPGDNLKIVGRVNWCCGVNLAADGGYLARKHFYWQF